MIENIYAALAADWEKIDVRKYEIKQKYKWKQNEKIQETWHDYSVACDF